MADTLTGPTVGAPWVVSVAALRRVADPTDSWPWNSIPPDVPTLDELMEWEPLDRPLNEWELDSWDPNPHLARIAWLARHGWDDPVELDVGCLGWAPEWPLLDGNHRLYAAIVRGDEQILVSVSGDIDLAAEMFELPTPRASAG